MTEGTRFVVYLMTAWTVACALVVGLIALVCFIFGWGVFDR